MSFKEVQDLDCDNTTGLGGFNKKTKKNNPKQLEGYYLGSREVASTKSRSGKCWIHILQTKDGKLGIWGRTDLDRKMLTVTRGLMVRATHVGMRDTPNGEMYRYSVEVDDENRIDVADLPSDTAAEEQDDLPEGCGEGPADDAEGDVGEEDIDEGDHGDAPDEPAPRVPRPPVNEPAPPSASTQEKVRALLNKKR